MQILGEEIGLLLLLFQLNEHTPARVAIISLLSHRHGKGGLHLFLLRRAGDRLDRVFQSGFREVLDIVRLIGAYC